MLIDRSFVLPRVSFLNLHQLLLRSAFLFNASFIAINPALVLRSRLDLAKGTNMPVNFSPWMNRTLESASGSMMK
jgi:hypothetical protein